MKLSSKVQRDRLLNSLPAEEREHLMSESVVIEVEIDPIDIPRRDRCRVN